MIAAETPTVRCPRCRTEQPEGTDECIRCGVIFAKYRPVAKRAAVSSPKGPFAESQWVVTARQWLIESDVAADSLTLVGRGAVFLLLVWWGWKLVLAPLETNYAGESVLHLINLPFHEAGHLIFMPFGRLMMFLGGSLGQILMPSICLGTFLVKTRDPFGASVCLWWTAESLMDVAPYINDARAMDLMLLGGVTGKETDGHDWNNILAMLGWLEYDHRLAHLVHLLGTVLIFVSLIWGGWLLLRHYRRLSM